MVTIKDSSKHNRDISKSFNAHFKGLYQILKKRITKKLDLSDKEVRLFLRINLRKIIISKPNELVKLQNDFENLNIIKNKNKKEKEEYIKNQISKIFDWDWFIDKNVKNRYSAYSLTEALKIRVCPYCNTNYILTISGKKEKIIRPALDHFFPKTDYPILALSFYNLIPSCTICNSSLKGSKPSDLENHFHPYIHDILNDITFDFIPYSSTGVSGLSEDFEIVINVNQEATQKSQAEGHIIAFKLKDIYNNHKDYISEILYKNQIANGSYMQSLEDAFPKLNLRQDEFYRIAYGNYLSEDDIGSRPMAKLCKDIATQLDDYFKP